MGESTDFITDNLAAWIKKQKLIFVSSAPLSDQGKVNVSPKGYDCFRILNPKQVCYLELTGSGIETQSHVEENGRITIMLCAFEGAPRILRIWGHGRVIRVDTPEFDSLFEVHYQDSDLNDATGKRSIIVVDVDQVGTSCGFGVPYFEYKGPRPTQVSYWKKKTEDQVTEYWNKMNRFSLDGLPGMRHERMGSEWSSHQKKNGSNWFPRRNTKSVKATIAGASWELGSPLANMSLVVAGISAGAAIATMVLRRQ
ncbi:hypothetical protein BGZ83_011221 [Gryganskiella cystojenkinii]|nr:hypothetical protein BGZ83_011221 [Gryganskiella cystojenkinii]